MIRKQRIIIMISLIIFIMLFGLITKIYEKKVVLKKNIQVVKNYSIFEKIKNFKPENKERYVRYYEKNKNLSYKEIIIRVNVGLDHEFYKYIKNTDITKENLILVNKYLKLEENYIPNNLEEIEEKYFINGNKNTRKLTKEAKYYFEKLSEASIKNNTPVYGQSAYRSYEKQSILYNNAKQEEGLLKADLDTARKGHSEHQTGLAIDVSSTKNGNMLDFDKTNSFNWMEKNAYKYGFILRYPKGKENIHGYIYEPWHYRYVGLQVAKDIHDNYSNLTFDEYYYLKLDIKKGPKS